jgi:hypothetical protein
VVRYLEGCRLTCQQMREGTLMAPYCTRERKKRENNEIVKIRTCSAGSVGSVRTRKCMYVVSVV